MFCADDRRHFGIVLAFTCTDRCTGDRTIEISFRPTRDGLDEDIPRKGIVHIAFASERNLPGPRDTPSRAPTLLRILFARRLLFAVDDDKTSLDKKHVGRREVLRVRETRCGAASFSRTDRSKPSRVSRE